MTKTKQIAEYSNSRLLNRQRNLTLEPNHTLTQVTFVRYRMISFFEIFVFLLFKKPKPFWCTLELLTPVYDKHIRTKLSSCVFSTKKGCLSQRQTQPFHYHEGNVLCRFPNHSNIRITRQDGKYKQLDRQPVSFSFGN